MFVIALKILAIAAASGVVAVIWLLVCGVFLIVTGKDKTGDT